MYSKFLVSEAIRSLVHGMDGEGSNADDEDDEFVQVRNLIQVRHRPA